MRRLTVTPPEITPPKPPDLADLGPDILLPKADSVDAQVAKVGDLVLRQSHAYSADKTSLLASTNWIHNVLRRLGRVEEASRIVEPIGEGMGYSGNYYKNILVYKGLRKESEVFDEETALGFQLGTMGYGMANWRRVNGDVAGAERLLRKVANGSAWHSNGVMAAEADLARRQ